MNVEEIPKGWSVGQALELRDGDKGRLLGKGVLKAICLETMGWEDFFRDIRHETRWGPDFWGMPWLGELLSLGIQR